MTLKTWVLGRVQRTGGVLGRGDLPPREEPPPAAADAAGAPVASRARGSVPHAEHLGSYAALVGAIRDELEHFIASHVRLHLAIADHDRFVLTSIHVACPDDPEAARLLQQFMHEFKPEQVKRYLAREVIAALPNAAAIDLSQFAGLLDADSHAEHEDDSDYGELLAALRNPEQVPSARAYRVSIVGRWTEQEARPHPSASSPGAGTPAVAPVTALAGQRSDFDIEDAEGKRRVVLHGVMAGRRYLIGKDASCDIRVNGTYTSRRHAEIWWEQGAWHVSDAGSTNGLRVESPGGPTERLLPGEGAARAATLTLAGGERIVLSAHAQGAPGDYPCVAVRGSAQDLAARVTPIAVASSSKTPVTPLRGSPAAAFQLRTQGAAGARMLEVSAADLPVSVGRSRNQTLVIGRAHELVSGHHLDIVALDEAGVQVVVHGDNGVVVDGVARPVGSRFLWRPGQSMVLDAGQPEGRSCALVLTRACDGGRA